MSAAYHLWQEKSTTSSNPTNGVIFFALSLLMGVACRHLLHGSRVPYTVALLLLGIGLGSLEYGTGHQLGKLGDGIRLWANIDPDLLLAVFLPVLLFEGSFSMEVHQIKRCMVQMLLLAGPGVFISTFCIGSALKLCFPYDWSWKTSLLLGAILSATDPVAVVALLKELGTSKKMSTIIEGESMMNDGASIVVYQLFYRMVLGHSFNWGAIVKFLTLASVGAVGIGLAFGIAAVLWLGFIFNDTVINLTLTLAVSFIAYFTAQVGAEISGILTVVTIGMFFAAAARSASKAGVEQSLHKFWEVIAYISNTLIFILSGVIIAEGILHNRDVIENHGNSWLYLFLLYVFIQVSRLIVVVLLYPVLQYFGYGLNWKEAIILVWSGLRGAVGLALSLSVKHASDDSEYLSPETGTLFVFFTGGSVFLTLLVNGSTTQFLLNLLGMDGLSRTERCELDYAKYKLLKNTQEVYDNLEDDDRGPVDWPTVRNYVTCLNKLDWEGVHPPNVSETNNGMDLKATRIRFLKVAQAAYCRMLDEGRITETTANVLMQSVNDAIDVACQGPLCDWNNLKLHVKFPKYFKYFQTNICPQKLARYFTLKWLQSACYICAAFLRAHRIARRQLVEFTGDNEITYFVTNESVAEEEEASTFLENVGHTFPQVLHAVKATQVTFSVLKFLSDCVGDFENDGLLEEKVVLHLRNLIQTDLEKLLKNPPLVKFPNIRDVLSLHPSFRTLPSMLCETLEGSTVELIKSPGARLYKKGSKPKDTWLIANGLVKCEVNNLETQHSLHSSFPQGSILGLYEVLVGKPYICNMIADSVVLCLLIETKKLLSMIKSSHEVEDFFWKESVIVMAKFLLPRVFGKMSMQEARALVAERSRMTAFLGEEIIEIPNDSIVFLLEGSLMAQDNKEELVEPPAALLHPYVDLSFLCPVIEGPRESFCYRASWYKVETRARIFTFEISSREADSALS